MSRDLHCFGTNPNLRGSVFIQGGKCFRGTRAAMLALEANHFIALRLSKMAFDTTEKIDAAVEASSSLHKHRDVSAVVAYLKHVDADPLSLR